MKGAKLIAAAEQLLCVTSLAELKLLLPRRALIKPFKGKVFWEVYIGAVLFCQRRNAWYAVGYSACELSAHCSASMQRYL
jgi:hypothetical protein